MIEIARILASARKCFSVEFDSLRSWVRVDGKENWEAAEKAMFEHEAASRIRFKRGKQKRLVPIIDHETGEHVGDSGEDVFFVVADDTLFQWWNDQVDSNSETKAAIPTTPTTEEALSISSKASSTTVTHSPDFRSVNWYGTLHEFTPQQAACVKVLWEAWENGTPAVGDATTLEAADSKAERLGLVFRDHPAWGTMIVDGATKGTHRLADPPMS